MARAWIFVLLFAFAVPSTSVLAQEKISPDKKSTIEKPNRLGIVTLQPKEKPYVKIDDGFMVPYTATIPGTEIKYTMIPIPGGKFTMGSPDDEDDRVDDEGPQFEVTIEPSWICLLYTSPSPRDGLLSRMPSSA